ncbi:MAG: cell division protein FtsQ/DivIB [Acidimicrobiales bacterium]
MTDPRIHERRVLVAREKGRHRRRLLVGALAVILLGSGGFALVHSSLLGARHVEIIGAAHAPYSRIVQVAGLAGAPPLVDLSAQKIAARVETLPWVRSATVSLSWPTTVSIRLTDRIPVAVVRAGTTAWAVVDPTGRVLEDTRSRPLDLPLITSPVKPPLPGRELSRRAATLARVAAAMPQSMVRQISALKWAPKGAVVELLGKKVALLGNTSLLKEKFIALATVLAKAQLTGIATIDLRVPSAPVLIH